MTEIDSELEQYRTTAGAEIKTADVSSDDHDLKEIVGNGGTQERVYDAQQAGARFVDFYDSSAASIREALSNAETACIRRARNELKDAGFPDDVIPETTTEMLDMAKSECNYEPLIEITYNRKSDETRLIIEDNGIGISVEEYKVVQHVGYSMSHSEGGQLGNFGIGWMSLFQLTGVNGFFKMSTKSYLTNDSYSTQEFVANFEMLDEEPDEYGTRFEFPGFGEAAKEIDIPGKVEEFTEGMPVPVLYRDFDADGNETHRSDDYLATRIEEDYDDDSMVVIFENEFFKAVMSPDGKVKNHGITTYNISMPIRRNTDSFGSSTEPFHAPWKWDFRGKKENGPIVACESDESLVGLIPKEDTKYDRLTPEMQDDCIAMSNVPDDAISMPEPASSRDSFKSNNDEFWKHVSQKLNESWAEIARERFVNLDTWDDFMEMDRESKEELFRAYDKFGPQYSKADPETIQDELEDKLDVTLDQELCARLHEAKSKVRVVNRGTNRAHTKGATTRKKIWEVIDEAPDGVYMAKSPSQRKSDIVWGLGDTHMVRLGSGETYMDYVDTWGWEKAKELPNQNLDQIDGLDQGVIDLYNNRKPKSNHSGSNTGGNGQDPSTYRMKVRTGTHSSDKYEVHNIDDVIDALRNDESISAGKWSKRCGKYLIIFNDDVSARRVANASDYRQDIVATRLPDYAYEYIKGVKNVYESKEELHDDKAGFDITLSDGSTMGFRELPETDMLISVNDQTKEYFEGRIDDLVEAYGYDPDEFERYTYIDADDIRADWSVSTDATVHVGRNRNTTFGKFSGYERSHTSLRKLKFRDKTKHLDKDHDKYDALFNNRQSTPEGDDLDILVEIAEDAGLEE